MRVYGLKADGEYELCSGHGLLWSKKLFLDKLEAEAHKTEFKVKCTAGSGFDFYRLLDSKILSITVVEHQLVLSWRSVLKFLLGVRQ